MNQCRHLVYMLCTNGALLRTSHELILSKIVRLFCLGCHLADMSCTIGALLRTRHELVLSKFVRLFLLRQHGVRGHVAPLADR